MQEKIVFANALRGVAALCVLIFHYCGVFWRYPVVHGPVIGAPETGAIAAAPAFSIYAMQPINLGYFGVALFFLISGFVIPFSFDKRSRASFAIGRVFRIWPTYLVGFSVTLAAIAINAYHWGVPFPYSLGDVAVHSVPGLRDVLGGPQIDFIIWTLEVEVKFYLIMLIISSLLRRGSLSVFAIPALLSFILFIPYELRPCPIAWTSIPYLSFMFVGTALNFQYREIVSRTRTLFIISGILGVIAFAAAPAIKEVAPDYLFAVLVFVAAMRFPWIVPDRRPTRFLSDISYPLYVCHGIAGYVLLNRLGEIGLSPAVSTSIAVPSALLVAFVIHKIVEVPTHKIGKKLGVRVGMSNFRVSRPAPLYNVAPTER